MNKRQVVVGEGVASLCSQVTCFALHGTAVFIEGFTVVITPFLLL